MVTHQPQLGVARIVGGERVVALLQPQPGCLFGLPPEIAPMAGRIRDYSLPNWPWHPIRMTMKPIPTSSLWLDPEFPAML
jgi:hypothetical protein